MTVAAFVISVLSFLTGAIVGGIGIWKARGADAAAKHAQQTADAQAASIAS